MHEQYAKRFFGQQVHEQQTAYDGLFAAGIGRKLASGFQPQAETGAFPDHDLNQGVIGPKEQNLVFESGAYKEVMRVDNAIVMAVFSKDCAAHGRLFREMALVLLDGCTRWCKRVVP
jgi:hypothetical protein